MRKEISENRSKSYTVVRKKSIALLLVFVFLTQIGVPAFSYDNSKESSDLSKQSVLLSSDEITDQLSDDVADESQDAVVNDSSDSSVNSGKSSVNLPKDAPEDATENTLDETSATDSSGEYRYIPRSQRGILKSTAKKAVSTYAVTESTDAVVQLSEDEQRIISEAFDILDKNEYFSQLSLEDVERLVGFYYVDAADMVLLESMGETLRESIPYAQMSKDFGIDIETLLSACADPESCRDVSIQLRTLKLYSEASNLDNAVYSELQTFILQGYSFEQVKTAYSIGNKFGIPMETLLADSDAKSANFAALSELENENLNLFAEDYGLNAEALKDAVVDKSLESEDIINEIENTDEAAMNTTEPAMSLAAAASNGSTASASVDSSGAMSPYTYDYSKNESVDLVNGALKLNIEDLRLPGKNGLDLVISRNFNSADSKLFRQESYYTYTCSAIKVITYYYYGTTVRVPQYDTTIVLGTYSDYAQAESAAATVNGQESWDYYYPPYSNIIGYVTGYVQVNVNAKPNWSMGKGWRLGFTSIDSEYIYGGYYPYLRLANGDRYGISITPNIGDSNLYSLIGHAVLDYRLEQESGAYSNGSVSSCYTLYYNDGKREYFSSDGLLIGIVDRYGNTISFVNSVENDLPRTVITDTAGRVVIISGQRTSNGHYMTVSMPDGRYIRYNMTTVSGYPQCTTLTSTTDMQGRVTSYTYSIEALPLSQVSVDPSGAMYDNTYYYDHMRLNTVYHSSGAVTQYNYMVATNNGNGQMIYADSFYRIASRYDNTNGANYKYDCYSYNVTNPWNIQYSVIVERINGYSTRYDFNEKKELKYETLYTYDGTTHPLYFTERTYNSQNLVVSESTRYVPNNLYCKSRSYDYDSKGNLLLTHETKYKAYGYIDAQTIYTYSADYNLLTSKQYMLNENTTVREDYTLTSDNKSIAWKRVYETVGTGSAVLKEATQYSYDAYGNATLKNEYYGDLNALSTYNQTNYVYDNNNSGLPSSFNGVYLTKQSTPGVMNATGSVAASTPGEAAGTIAQKYTYNWYGSLITSVDGNGNTTGYTYDNLGRLLSKTNPDGSVLTQSYNDSTNKTTVTNEVGTQLEYSYNGLGVLTSIKDVASGQNLAAYTYDTNMRKTSETTPTGRTEYSYDQRDQMTSLRKYADPGSSAVIYEETYEYTDAFTDANTTSPLTRILKTVVGDATSPSIVTATYTYWPDQVVKTSKFINGVEYFENYTYDDAGNRLTVKTPYTTANYPSAEYSSKWTYDYANRVLQQYTPDGYYLSSTYDALGRKTSARDCKANATGASYAATYNYDALGRLITESTPIQMNGGTVYYQVKMYYYDANGNIIQTAVTNNLPGAATTWSSTGYTYDNHNNLTLVTSSDGVTTSYTKYTYNAVGNKRRQYTGLASPTPSDGSPYTSYTYDRFGNMLTLTDSIGQTESYTYDLSGNILTKTDRNGAVTTCTYDGMNRLLTSMVLRNAVQTGSTSITYAKTGAKASESNANVTKNYTYDGLGRLISETETGGIVKTYGYDIGDNRTSMTLTVSGVQQMSMGYTYDIAKRLSTVSEGGAQQASYSYDANGNRLSLTYPNGNTTAYTYNIGNMVTRLENKQGSAILSAYDYAYYLDGNQRSKADNTGKVTTYVYDSLGRLKSETETGTTSSAISYTYDLNSNRSTMTVDSADDYVVYYWYDANNRLLFTAKAQGTANTGTAYFYDGNGNTISTKEAALPSSNYVAEMAAMRASVPTAATTGVTLYGYDGYNRQTSVSSNATTSTYTYNPDGLRRSKTVDGVVTRHIWEGQNIVAELDGNSAVTNRFIRGINLIAGKNSSSVLTYYLFNAHGDVVGLTNTSGAVTKSYDYDAFGNEKSIVSTDTNPFRYCAEYYDKENGTIYLRARYYSPVIGRFTSEDINTGKATESLSLNLYTYCFSNPVLYIDVSGNWPTLIETTRAIARGLIANPATVYATQQGWFSDAFYVAGFARDLGGVYHARQDAIQQYGGYNYVYDMVFDYATSMKAQPFQFTYNDQDYRFWAWKGDYLNLGAGAELGIYTRMSVFGEQTDHWLVDTSLALPMTMTLTDNDGNLLASYNPSEPQWWITSFNSIYQGMSADSLIATYTVDFSGNTGMFDAFYKAFKNNSIWTFDTKNYIAILNF